MEDPEDVGFGLIGVAPEADIYMYRVFACTGGARSDDIMAAFNQAYLDGVHVVSLSLGLLAERQIDDPFQIMTNKLVSEGIAVIAAAGNDGGSAAPVFSPSAPGIGADVISVGSIDNAEFPSLYTAIDSEGYQFNYAAVWPYASSDEGFNVYILEGTGTGCMENEWVTARQVVTNPQDTVVILHNDAGRDCTTATKMGFWIKYGFSRVMLYNIASTNPYQLQYNVPPQQDMFSLVTNLLTPDGERVDASYRTAGGYPNYRMVFRNNTISSKPISSGGMISVFSSYGPTWDTLALKPQLSAPGGGILATWPLGYNAGYAVIRGTSMATPFVSACYALVKSQFPSLGVWEIRELLQSTSTPVPTAYNPSQLASVIQQGAGLINPFKAITQSTIATPTQFEIGDLDGYSGAKLNFSITNKSPIAKSYQFSHSGASLVMYQSNGTQNPHLPIYASAEFAAAEISINAGETAAVSFGISPPNGIDEDTVPIISGFIHVKSSQNEEFNIPYEGLPYSRHDAQYMFRGFVPVDDSEDSELIFIPNILFFSVDKNEIVTDNGSGVIIIDRSKFTPFIDNIGPLFSSFQGTPYFRVDILPANTSFVPTFYGYNSSIQWDYVFPNTSYKGMLDDRVTPTYGLLDSGTPWRPVAGYPPWNDLDTAAIGDYRIMVSELRWGGNKTVNADWETWLSPIIRVTDSTLPNNGLP
jgi:hypothetical protein